MAPVAKISISLPTALLRRIDRYCRGTGETRSEFLRRAAISSLEAEEHREAVRRYLAQKGQAYPHLIDPTGAIAIDFGVTGVPESFFIDKQGLIVHKEAQALYPQTLQPLLARIRQ